MSSDPFAMNGRELDTVLAALRLWQAARARDAIPAECLEIAANRGAPLGPRGTDALAERLLFAGLAETARRRNRP